VWWYKVAMNNDHKREMAAVISGIGTGIIFLVLGMWLEAIPDWAMIFGLIGGGLLVLVGFGLMLRPSKDQGETGPTQSQSRSTRAQQVTGAGGDIYQAGDDITINPTPQPNAESEQPKNQSTGIRNKAKGVIIVGNDIKDFDVGIDNAPEAEATTIQNNTVTGKSDDPRL